MVELLIKLSITYLTCSCSSSQFHLPTGFLASMILSTKWSATPCRQSNTVHGRKLASKQEVPYVSKQACLDVMLVLHACHNDAKVGLPRMGCMLGGDRDYECVTSGMLSRDAQ